jgi:hypothetical protein
MSRLLCAAAIGLTLVSAGCCMCDSPHDYCGPTFLGGCGEPCMEFERYGSAISNGHCPYHCGHGHCETCGDVTEGPVETVPAGVPAEMYYDEDAPSPPGMSSRPMRRASARRALYEPPSVPQPRGSSRTAAGPIKAAP